MWEGFPTEPADSSGVFRAFEELLEMIGRARPFWAAVGAIMAILRVSGLQPDLTVCSSCSARIEGGAAFSPRQQDLICGDCLSRARAGEYADGAGVVLLDAGLVRFLGRLARLGLRDAEGLGRVSERRVRNVIRLLEAWFHATIGREPRSLKMLAVGSSRRTG